MNFTESRSHFGLWVVTSAPLILGLDLRDKAAVDFAWPIITNTEALAVHSAWPSATSGDFANATHPGALVVTDGVYTQGRIQHYTWQVWAKNVSANSVAVLLVNTGDAPQDVQVNFHQGIVPCVKAGQGCTDAKLAQLCAPVCSATISGPPAVKVRDLWNRKALPDMTDGKFVANQLGAHDSAFVLVSI